jgi:hypothetical protein
MKKLITMTTMLLLAAAINAQTITEVKYQSSIKEYAVYVTGKSKPNCYLGGGNKIVGYGKDFVLVEYNHIYFTKDFNCKTIASKETANLGVVTVSESTIKTKQSNGTYTYNKYWKLK